MSAPAILILDSVTRFGPEARGAIAIAASHGGVYAAHMALEAGVVGLVLNDAGVGLARAGIGGLAYCDTWRIPCATVDYRSARIGDGPDCAARGVVSYLNDAADRLGIYVGMAALEAAFPAHSGEPMPTGAGLGSDYCDPLGEAGLFG